ncbi:MAG: C_GCAxxG_C_C family protein [Oscillospiraceae bacterium]|nr:C_GCAxxG_C_C family protein [Oscillospiraceae bacterium]
MTKQERCKKALDCHAGSLNCAQSVLSAFSDRIGLSDDQCYALCSGFGGGVRYGGLCGAVSAAVMVLGLLYPHTPKNGLQGKARSMKLTQEFQRRFRERFGELDCRELLRLHDLHGTAQTEALGVTAHCDILIVSATELLCDMLEELEKE